MDQELKQYLEAMESRMDAKLGGMEQRLMEKLQDVQTELLRAFAAAS